MIAPARPAATVLVLRPAHGGYELFMVQRHRKSGFMPHAWVFPGGRVDEADALAGHERVRGGEASLQQLGLGRERGVAFLVAAVRETFEEAGIWLGAGELGDEARDALNQRRANLGDLLDAQGLTLDLDCVHPWSWWVTPDNEPRRYDTRFLVAIAPDAQGEHDEHETVDSAWYRPADALRLAQSGELPMAPPTWWTLTELAALPTLDAVRAALPTRPRRAIQPILAIEPDGLSLTLPGHPSHPEPAIEGLPSQVHFKQGRWWSEA